MNADIRRSPSEFFNKAIDAIQEARANGLWERSWRINRTAHQRLLKAAFELGPDHLTGVMLAGDNMDGNETRFLGIPFELGDFAEEIELVTQPAAQAIAR